jgi:acyl-CoA synthetase (AMP-forming)/AMP-acid ligase II/enoyl-CoA hydratase/carnithine racemase
MSSKTIIISHPAPSVVKITLNRPERMNALNAELLRDLTDALRAHRDAHVIILEGTGDRAFCAGEDLKETLAPRAGSAEELRIAFTLLQDITRLTSSSSAIVVSAVQGYAVGGGAEIALAADFVIGSPNAKFRFPEVTLGHAVTGGISLRLSHMVGLLKAKELLICGRTIAADEALRIGLLSEVANDAKARAEELALELAKLPTAAASSLKMSLEQGVFPNMESALHDEVNAASYCFARTEATEAFKNFANRKQTQLQVRDVNTALRLAVQKYPAKVFIRCQGQDVTFQDFDSSVAALASGLRSAGVQAGDRVLVMMKNSLEMVHTWMASNRLGAVWVPVNTDWRSLTLKSAVAASEATLAIVDAEYFEAIKETGAFKNGLIWVLGGDNAQDFSKLYHNERPLKEAFAAAPGTTSAFLYTSGTTGKSKPCILSHEYFIIQATHLIESCKLRSDDVLYCPFPLFHADATALTVIPAILLGATAALSPRFTASRFWDEIRETQATVYDFMGATLALIYKQSPSPRDRDHRVRLAWGVPIPAFAEAYENRFGHPLRTLYGSVEASIPITQREDSLISGSCGVLRPGYQLRIANGEDEPLPPNTAGHLLLRSDNPNAFFQGYFNDPVNTLEAYANMWLHTGDIAKVDERGNVFFLGRVKDVIRRRGENINALEVEEEFLQHPDVLMAAAYAIPSELGVGTEDDLKVAVKVRGGSSLDENALWQWSQQHLARQQVPAVIEIVEELKQTLTGKIEKSSLTVKGGKRFTTRLARL